jgi:hypothetical protein
VGEVTEFLQFGGIGVHEAAWVGQVAIVLRLAEKQKALQGRAF